MARRKKKDELRAGTPQPIEVPVVESEPRYPLEIWMENTKALLKVSRYALVGALHGVSTPAGGFTKSELEAHLHRFQSKPIG